MDEQQKRSWLPKAFRRRQLSLEPTDSPSERTSLLQPQPAANSHDSDATEQAVKQPRWSWWHQVAIDVGLLLKNSAPVIAAYALQNSLQTASVMVVGQRSPRDLATAAFAYMFAMSTAWLIALGGTTAIDTLGSTAFTGSKNPHDLGIILQRAFFVLTLFYMPVSVLWFFSEPVFRLLGQEAQLSHDSAVFLRCLIPGGLGYVFFEAMKKYLQAQEIMGPGTYVLLITSPLNLALNYVFVYTLDLGIVGAPLATGVSYWLAFALLVAYVRMVAGSAGWGGWSRRSLRNLGPFARLALLGILHVGTEWWAFEVVALAAGRLGTIPLAAQSVIMTADQVLNTIPFSIGVVVSARIGNLLGAQRARAAARAAHVAAWLSVALGAVVLAVLMASKDSFGRLFNGDERVVRLTARVMPYVALFQIADGLNGSCGGSLRGMGRQHVGAAVNLVSYYLGALPLGIYLAFRHGWGLAGLWAGQCIALYLVGLVQWAIVALSDWEAEVRKALARMDPEQTRPAVVTV